MIDQTRIQQFMKRLLKSSSVEERQAINPPREWALGILLTLIGVGVGGAVSYLSYLNTVSVEVSAAAITVSPATYKGALAEEAVLRFRERAVRFASIRDYGGNAAPVTVPVAPTETVIVPTPTEAVPAEDVPEVPETPVEETSVSEPGGLTPELSF